MLAQIAQQRIRCKKVFPLILLVYVSILLAIVYRLFRNSPIGLKEWPIYSDNMERLLVQEKNSLIVPAGGDFDFTLDSHTAVRNITILMWTEYYHNKDMTDHIKNESPIPDWCNVTFDRRMFNKSEALVFHIPDLDMRDLPPRKQEVPWVYFTLESPICMQSDAGEFSGYFNRTMSYRLDSDFTTPYGFFQTKQTPLVNNPTQQPDFPKKTKLVAWMVSHCSTVGKREFLVDQLKKFVAIDIYGDCGTLKCDKAAEEPCYKMLGERYMFYLSFENSVCHDYVTEKFTNALKYNLVPIVYGGGNYSAILPYPKSFVDVRDFQSAHDLAKYLNYLHENRTAYAEYFEWRRFYDVHIRQGFHGFKKLCYALQRGDIRRTKVYEDMRQWWTNEGDCKNGLDIEWSDIIVIIIVIVVTLLIVCSIK